MRIGWIALLLLSLNACGFQLRGSYELPPRLQSVELDLGTPNGEMARSLKRSLRSAGVSLQEQSSDNTPKLVVGAVRHKRRTLSVDTAGNPQEYELTASTSLAIPEMADGYQLSSREFSVRRDYIYESTGVLSSSDQEAQLKIEMERELARRIMRALHSAR